MPKAFFSLFLMAITFVALGQGAADFVQVSGQVLSAKDSSAVSAKILYEKLPYYDDMGIANSDNSGNFQFFLLRETGYNFRITKSGFQDYTGEVKIVDEDKDGTMALNFYIEPEEEPDLITLDNLIFNRGSDVITSSSYAGLDELVAYLDERPNIVIQLEGHTDFAGNAEANMRLSQARVDAVKEYLVKQGVKKNRVFTKAFGGTQPLFTERTDEAKTKNRRVEVRIIRR
ncbi:OmpA family protein [Marinoscillum furvescens]|uniref:Outer membrane protein OmpA-like peptidoglycan-associated protein n=1 Tax=Marinoscillum furvescens DSM 4134 TaxID=1122208 RepID=A0A3D9L4T2_MARFU|nr:OmpA family protein [Marinoscillum furvescens]RED98937.1 outer membrane protein OmpA-like peptidoglycan-associated protein [Marinoscillum furvescens DSM 4134]